MTDRKAMQLRLPDDVKSWLAGASTRNSRSQNAEIVNALRNQMCGGSNGSPTWANAPQRLVGIMHPDSDVDHFPIREQMPDGFIGFLGSCTSGEADLWPMVEGRLLLEDNKIDFLMSIDQAREALALLQSAIAAAEEAETTWPNSEVQHSETDA